MGLCAWGSRGGGRGGGRGKERERQLLWCLSPGHARRSRLVVFAALRPPRTVARGGARILGGGGANTVSLSCSARVFSPSCQGTVYDDDDDDDGNDDEQLPTDDGDQQPPPTHTPMFGAVTAGYAHIQDVAEGKAEHVNLTKPSIETYPRCVGGGEGGGTARGPQPPHHDPRLSVWA